MTADPFYAALAAAGLVTVLAAVGWRWVTHSLVLSAPMLALAAGVGLGPAGLGWVTPAHWTAGPADGGGAGVLHHMARVTLAVSLMGVGLRLPWPRLRPRLPTAAVLLGPVMLAMWAASAGLAWLVLGLSGWEAALVGAVIVPTDPVLAGSIVTGRQAREHLPRRLRDAISLESGANDGLALPFVALALAFLPHVHGDPAGDGDPAGGGLSRWLTHAVLWEVAFGGLLGAACGWAAGKALRLSERHRDIDHPALLTYAAAVAAATLGLSYTLGLDAPLAVFAAGLALASTLRRGDREEEVEVQEGVERLILLPAFLVLGAALPWAAWAELGWRGPAFAAAVLLFRRPPWVWLLGRWCRDLPRTRDRLFAGWFGPIGIAAVFYAAEARHASEVAWPAATLCVAASVLAHGATATGFTRRYGGDADAPDDRREA